MTALVSVSDLELSYQGPKGAVPVLNGLNWSVDRGQFIAVKGPSGSGKSTLLLLLGALLSPSAGSVTIADENLNALGQGQRDQRRAELIGFLFQRFHLLPYLSVRDNIAAAGLTRSEGIAAERVDELLTEFGLEERAQHRPAQLSVGQMQRCAMARALAGDPALLLADEPTGNLDETNADLVLDRLAARAAAGHSVIMVTHDSRAAARADEVWQLRDGKLEREAA